MSEMLTVEYRFYELDCNGRISCPAKKFQLRDDTNAEKHAKRIIENQDIEIWCGSRLVSTIHSELWVPPASLTKAP